MNTSDRDLGEYNVSIGGSNIDNTQFTLRDLQLDIAVDDTNVSTDDTIETDVSAVAGTRDIEATLLDSGDDEINTSSVTTLDGQGEADVDFATATADGGNELDTGTYTVEVTDNATGVTVESTEITVNEADDEEASFVDSVITDQRGDVLEATVEMTETDTATLTFGSEDDGVLANASVEDEDGDDQVTVYINTYVFFSTGDVYSLDSDSDDDITSQSLDQGTSDLIDAGDYDLEVQAQTSEVDVTTTSDPVDDSDDVATVTLEERGTQEFRTWTMPDSVGNPSDLEDVSEAVEDGDLTRTSDISNGDVVVHELQATGLEGALVAQDNEDVTSALLNSDL